MDGIHTAWVSVAFDVVLVAAIIGLWVAWLIQVKQRKKVELLLRQASADLQAATTLLHQVMCQMPKHESATTTAEVAKQTTSAQEQEHMQRNVQKLQTASLKQKVAKDQPQDSSMATKIMRLNREGLDMQSIAQQLSLPLAQVRLMLLLQTPKT